MIHSVNPVPIIIASYSPSKAERKGQREREEGRRRQYQLKPLIQLVTNQRLGF
jgi:hypothetical protein